MYIVNTTFIVEADVHEQWYAFFRDKFLPYVRSIGFGGAGRRELFSRVLTDAGDPHYTYSLQVEVADTGEYRRFMEEAIGEYVTISGPIFGEKALYFASLLKPLDL